MLKDYGRKQITFGFTMVCLLFSIPIIFLFYFMITFKNANILFVQEEIKGVAKIKEVINKIKFNDQIDIVGEVRNTGNESKLILDSDLDSYYIMHVAIINIPRIYSFLNQLEQTREHVDAEKRKAILILIKENMDELLMGIRVAKENDARFYGVNAKLQSSEFEDMAQMMANLFQSEGHLSNIDQTKNVIEKFWSKTLNVLVGILKDRQNSLVQERTQAMIITLGSWILSFVLVIYFSNVVLNRQKDLYERVELQNIKLTTSSKMSALGEMAGGIAHEVNTPLSIILMRTEQLIASLDSGDIDKAEFKEALDSIEQTVQRISKIVLGLRSFARDGSKDPLEIYSIEKVVNETFRLCQERFRNHNVGLEFSKQEDIKVLCRPIELSQVLLNLLNNSFDATEALSERWVKVILKRNEKKEVVISVVDSGRGVPKELQSKLMQPFFTTKETGKGTGLGLSISQGLMASQGGRLVYDENSDHTKFDIVFRAA